MKDKTIRFDWAIKDLLRKKENFGILEGFLNELLKDVIHIKEVLESIKHESVIVDDRIDLLVKNSKSELMIVEIQIYKETDYLERMQYGVSKTIGQTIDRSGVFKEVRRICSISILYFDLEQAVDYIYSGATSLKGIHNDHVLELSDKQKDMFIKAYPTALSSEYYLLSLHRFEDVINASLDLWIYYLKNGDFKQVVRAKGLAEAITVFDESSMSAQDRHDYDRFLRRKEVTNTVLKNAELEGRMIGKTEMVLAALKKGLPAEFLADVFDLKLTFVQSVINEHVK